MVIWSGALCHGSWYNERIFAFNCKETGKKELVTAPLDGTILEGVTRDSILTLARKYLDPNEWEINERYFTIHEVQEKAHKGELLEAFGSGTAAIVSLSRRLDGKTLLSMFL